MNFCWMKTTTGPIAARRFQMGDYSIKELRTLATRAACGAYLPWGVAEEAGASVAWLASRGHNALQPYVDLLQAFEGQNPATIGQHLWDDTTTCPILVGTHISDRAGANIGQQALAIPSVQSPILLVPFLMWVAGDLGQNLEVRFADCVIILDPKGFEIISGKGDLLSSNPQTVSVSVTDRSFSGGSISHPRTQVADNHREILAGFVEKTYLPESEQSRASGAGGGSVDDD